MLGKDELFLVAMKLDIPDLLRFCSCNKKLYNNQDIWNYRMKNFNKIDASLNNKESYILLYQLTTLKSKLNLTHTIFEIYQLEILEVSYNKLKKIPKEIKCLINLKELSFLGNLIEVIPREIKYLKNLEKLNLSDNQIVKLPRELIELPGLRRLYLSSNKIEEFPAYICHIKNLKDLALINNCIRIIPKEIGNLKSLEVLYVSYNPILSLPKELANTKLVKLFTAGTLIEKLPLELKYKKDLKIIHS